jgi:uncharacterized membrane protein
MNATVNLALATAAFVGSHLVMSHPLRMRLVQNLGEKWFLLLYSGVSFATLGWMILAWRSIDESWPLWWGPHWAWPVGAAVMLLACILLVGSFVRNPSFPHPGAVDQQIRPATGVFAITRHPMNVSFILWALVHLAIWGSPPNVIVAGGILILALFGSIGQDRKKLNTIGQPWRDWMARTSFLPFAALLSGRARWRAAAPGWVALIGGLLLWLALTWIHVPGVSPIALLLR